MLQVKNIEVYDLEQSIIACRNAMRTELPEYTAMEFNKGLERAKKLAKTPDGSGHQTFLSGIKVSFDLIYPNYLSPQLQRYHWIDIVSSSSKMHTIMKMDFSKCCNKYVTEHVIQLMKIYIHDYNHAEEIFKHPSKDMHVTKERMYELFMRVISNCPQGIELFMRVSTNYLQLKTIYHQRKNHMLKEDWGEFCGFIESLPYANELIKGE